ncbi:hypothetical protein KQX54_001819 [Cotesia glomerata]|uniref:Uncharacterized protein n=1 Tax=Cotesia glomerata TaxID=32391 RepID=A0AAV7IE74_COTGL|nr:hypothetical protein KQX54_001819 [Cotesia glomerata]
MMGSALSYEMVIPEEWYLNFSKQQIFDEIKREITKLQQDKIKFDEMKLKIGETQTRLEILDIERCWCFVREGDVSLNAENYFFSGNLITEKFPASQGLYTINQQRRTLQILSFNLSNFNLNNEDEGFFNQNRIEYLSTSEQQLQYQVIVPKVWLQQLSLTEIIAAVDQRIAVILDSEDGIEEGIFTIAAQPTILEIINEKFCWWFRMWYHQHPTLEDYIFTGDVLQKYFPELTIKKMD